MLLRRSSVLAVKALKDILWSECLCRQTTFTARELLFDRYSSVVKYASRVTLKLCVELLMRVVCCAFDYCRPVTSWLAAAPSRPFAVYKRLTSELHAGSFMWVLGPVTAHLRTETVPFHLKGLTTSRHTSKWGNNTIMCVWGGHSSGSWLGKFADSCGHDNAPIKHEEYFD